MSSIRSFARSFTQGAGRNLFSLLAAGMLLLGVTGSASASVLSYVGGIDVVIAGLEPLSLAGAGTALVNGSGGGNHVDSLGVPMGAMGTTGLVLPVTDPAAFPIGGLQVTVSNATGAFDGGSSSLTGVMPLNGGAKVCFYASCAAAVANITVPLSVVGAGGTVIVQGPVNVTVQGAPWVKGPISGFRGTPLTGFAHGPVSGTSSTAQASGVLSLVSPIFISTNIGASPVLPASALLSLVFDPAPKPTLGAPSPNPLEFGNVLVGDSAPARSVVLPALGSATLSITAFDETGPDCGDFGPVQPAAPFDIPGGDSAMLSVGFTPSAPGLKLCELLVHSNDVDNTPVVVQLRGTGDVPDVPTLGPLSSNLLELGDVMVGASAPARSVVLPALGSATLSITTVDEVGPDCDDFGPVQPAAPFDIPGGDSAMLSVGFTPSAPGLKLCGLLVHSNDVDNTPVLVQLRGTGDVPSELTVTLDIPAQPGRVGEELPIVLDVENNTNRTEPFMLVVLLVAADGRTEPVLGPMSVHLEAGANPFETGVAPLEASMVGINTLVAAVLSPGFPPTDVAFHAFEVRN